VSISQRIRERIPRRPVHLEDAVLDLQACHAELSADFDIFFPELVAFTAEWKRTAPVSIDLNPPLPEPVVPIG
jgi:acyl carrier protein phosphodiesterase